MKVVRRVVPNAALVPCRPGGRHELARGCTGILLGTQDGSEDATVLCATVAETGSAARVIDQILGKDESQPKKQRHHAERIFSAFRSRITRGDPKRRLTYDGIHR
jgi:hypothetical protein